MPQLDSAKKALRQNRKRRVINDRWRSAVRQALREVREAITAKDKTLAASAYIKVQKVLDRAARRNVIHPNKAARKKSRLLKSIAKI